MAVVRFSRAATRRACCDDETMLQAWGQATTRAMHRRLQQLEAMTSVEDLAFLPCDSYEREDGRFVVGVTEHLSLVIEQDTETTEGMTMKTIVVTALIDERRRTGRRQ